MGYKFMLPSFSTREAKLFTKASRKVKLFFPIKSDIYSLENVIVRIIITMNLLLWKTKKVFHAWFKHANNLVTLKTGPLRPTALNQELFGLIETAGLGIWPWHLLPVPFTACCNTRVYVDGQHYWMHCELLPILQEQIIVYALRINFYGGSRAYAFAYSQSRSQFKRICPLMYLKKKKESRLTELLLVLYKYTSTWHKWANWYTRSNTLTPSIVLLLSVMNISFCYA